MAITSTDAEEMLRAQLELWHNSMGYVKSKSLKCAMDLRIADAILHCGGTATLSDLLAATGLPPSYLHYLRRLMRVLTHSRIFALVQRPAVSASAGEGEQEEAVYALTAASRLLVVDGDDRGSAFSMFPIIHPTVSIPYMLFSGMHAWMKDERAATTSPFQMATGAGLWESLKANPDMQFSKGMAAETGLTMDAVLAESPAVFQGVGSLVDVGGGYGTAAAAVARAFPHVKCTVLDLPQVVAKAPAAADGAGGSELTFVAGDMFEHIPPADVILLKWVLHDWNDADCVKILRQCKKAIPPRDAGGKVIIIETVVGSRPHDTICQETQVLVDLHMMLTNGVEREEREWKKVFLEAGFVDYKITPMPDHRSIIEVYP